MTTTDEMIDDLHVRHFGTAASITPQTLSDLADKLRDETYQMIEGERLWGIGRWRLTDAELIELIIRCHQRAGSSDAGTVALLGTEVGNAKPPAGTDLMWKRIFVLDHRGLLDGPPVDYRMPGLTDLDREILRSMSVVDIQAPEDEVFFLVLSATEREVSISRCGQIAVEHPLLVAPPHIVSAPLWAHVYGTSPEAFKSELLQDDEALDQLLDHLQTHDPSSEDRWTPELLRQGLECDFAYSGPRRTPVEDLNTPHL